MSDDDLLETARLRRALKEAHRENEDDELTEADLELLRAYDPREWDSIDSFLEDYFSDDS